MTTKFTPGPWSVPHFATAKGAMTKIAASKARCQQWEIKNGKVVCE